MATLRRLQSDSLPALIQEASEKYADWFLVGTVPEEKDGPPYVLLMRTALDEFDVSEGEKHA
jgi:hypothetical protein